jgi:hypothetical protein
MVEIDYEVTMKSGKIEQKTAAFDIYIAGNDEDQYQGRAKCKSKGVSIDWTIIHGENLLQEMIKKCRDLAIILEYKGD